MTAGTRSSYDPGVPAGGHDDDVVRVAEMFADVARSLAAHDDVHDVLDKIVKLAVEHLEGCEFASVSLVEARNVTSSASTGEVPETLDLIQTELGEGPCLDAIREQEIFQTGDVAAEQRWPRFSQRAHDDTGVRSILALRLFVEGETMGALNLYSTAPDAFDETDVALAAVFAAHAAVAMSAARREQNLERKAASRDLIGQAKGILMARSNVDDQTAFEMLRRASQRMNIKLVEIAERLVHPDDPNYDRPA